MAGGDDATRDAAPQSFTVDGNTLHILETGRARLDALLRLIDEAQESLRLLYYVYSPDEAGTRVRDALERAIGRGVSVSLTVDGFGSSAPADFFAPLEENGASICRFIPRYGRRYLLRNHQKLAIADEQRALVGGFNIEDNYFDDDGPEGWRDLGLYLEGPAAKRLVGYFDGLAQWTRQDKARLRDLRRSLARWSEPKGGAVRWLLGGPTRKLSPWARTVRSEMRGAHRLDLVAAYFAPNPMMMRRIETIARRGGKARVLTASKSDNKSTIAAARHTYSRLLDRGVRIFEYQPRRLHTKLFVIDNVVHIGSANFDIRSLYLNLELMLRIEDRAFADYMRAYVERELESSREITPEEHEKAGPLDRLRWSMAYYLVTVVDNNITRRLNFGVED